MEITTISTAVIIGQDDIQITCSVLRGNPANYVYSITHVDTGSTTSDSTLTLTDIQVGDLGTYHCDVTNDAGTGSANVTIEQGGSTFVSSQLQCLPKLNVHYRTSKCDHPPT